MAADSGVAANNEIGGSYSALFLASWRGHAAIVQMLLAEGATVNHQIFPGDVTALMVASEQGHAAVVQILLAHGADVNLQSDEIRTVLRFSLHGQEQAQENVVSIEGSATALSLARTTEISQLLKEAGAK